MRPLPPPFNRSAVAKASSIDTDDLFNRLTEPRESKQAWVDVKGSSLEDSDMPAFISTHWNIFRQRWQWDNRGKTASEAGFPAYLNGERKRLQERGHGILTSAASFEETIKRKWDNEPVCLEKSGLRGFAAYTQAVTRRLAKHHFTRQFRLLEDPCQQDDWTTWVEYLSYIYWWRDKHAADMKASEPRNRRAWKELGSLDWSQYSSITRREKTVSIDVLDALIAKINSIAPHFFSETRPYDHAEAACNREEYRAQLILERLSLMEARLSKIAKDDISQDSKKKRKREDDLNDIEPQARPKRTKVTRQKGHNDVTSKRHRSI